MKQTFAFIRSLPKNSQFQTKVLTGSMIPTLYPQDIINITKTPFSQIKITDIINFYNPKLRMLIVHRVVKISSKFLTTKGDNNGQNDEYKVDSRHYLGVVSVLPYQKTKFQIFFQKFANIIKNIFRRLRIFRRQ